MPVALEPKIRHQPRLRSRQLTKLLLRTGVDRNEARAHCPNDIASQPQVIDISGRSFSGLWGLRPHNPDDALAGPVTQGDAAPPRPPGACFLRGPSSPYFPGH